MIFARRSDLPSLLCGALAIAAFGCSAEPTDPGPDLFPADSSEVNVSVENQRPGRERWNQQNQPNSAELAIWANPASAKVGDTLKLYVQLAFPPATVRVLRIGNYGGMGARRVAEVVIKQRVDQPACTQPFPGPVECPWVSAGSIPLGTDITGGVYQLVAKDSRGVEATYPLVVTSRRPHDFNIVIPQFTWQAYNSFGGSNFYTTDPNTRRPTPWVSFARPYAEGGQEATGTSEFDAISWLESQGLDLGYLSDADLATGLGNPANKGYIFVGHSEYWTYSMYQRIVQWKNEGKHLLFLNANNAYWNTRFFPSDSGRAGGVLYCYKGDADPLATAPEQVTTRFRSPKLGLPENSLYGIAFPLRLVPPPMTIDYVATRGGGSSDLVGFLLNRAGLAPGDSLGISTGSEGDDLLDNGSSPANLGTILSGTTTVNGAPLTHRTTIFQAPSGALVFATGTNRWTAYLLPSSTVPKANWAIQKLTRGVLDLMNGQTDTTTLAVVAPSRLVQGSPAP